MIADGLAETGSGQITLKPDTPPDIIEFLAGFDNKAGTSGFGFVVVRDTRVDPAGFAPSAAPTLSPHSIFEGARHSFLYRDFGDDAHTLKGPGPAALLGEGGYGDFVEGVPLALELTFDDWITAVIEGDIGTDENAVPYVFPASQVYRGDINPPANGTTNPFGMDVNEAGVPLTAREYLNRICDYYGVEWRIDADLRIHIGYSFDLFPSGRTIIARRSGDDPRHTTVAGEHVGSGSLAEYITRIIGTLPDPGANQPGIIHYKGPKGTPLRFKQLGNTSDSADQTVAAHAEPTRTIDLSGDVYDIGTPLEVGSATAPIIPGEWVHIYDPILGFVDMGNPVQFRGGTIWPKAVRVSHTSTPVGPGRGVYFVYWDESSDHRVLDLSDFYVPELSATEIQIGPPPSYLPSHSRYIQGSKPSFYPSDGDHTYTAQHDGTLSIDLYGASGYDYNEFGGLGARVQVPVPVLAGDVIKLKVGGKGKLNAGGADGGAGGGGAGGGGGGSTRCYLNDVLVAVAAGGGGATLDGDDNVVLGGHGGGPDGAVGAGGGTGGAGGVSGATPGAGGTGAGTGTDGDDGGADAGGDGGTGDLFGGGGGGGHPGGGGGGGAEDGQIPGAGGGGASWVDPTLEPDSFFYEGVRAGGGQAFIYTLSG